MSDIARNAYLPVTGRPLPEWTERRHTGGVYAVTFFKDGRRVVTGSEDRTLRIWDVNRETFIGGPFKGHQGGVRSVSISPDNTLIASGGDDNTVIIWDVESRQKVFNLEKHTDCVNSVCFSPDGTRLASGSDDETVVVWDVETGKVLAKLEGHDNWVTSVAFSPNGLKLASASEDNTIRVWHTDKDKTELLLQINAHRIQSVVWSPDSQQLVSASDDKTVRFWDPFTGLQIGQPCMGHTHHVFSVAISTDGSFIVTTSRDKTVRLWSSKSHEQIGQAFKHTDQVSCVAISPTGGLLVSGGEDGTVRHRSIKDILEQCDLDEILKDSIMQLQGHDTNNELSGDNDSTSNHSSETREASGASHGKHSESLFDILAVNMTVLHACIAGDLRTAEELLVQEIEADAKDYDSYANRSIVMARGCEWDHALQDAVKSIAIQPSLLGYISKGISLCGKEQLSDAMEAFDLGLVFSNGDAMVMNLLLLIKAIVLFNANYHDEAMRRVQDLATACQRVGVDTLLCTVVDSYLRVQRGIVAFEDRQYSDATDQLTTSITNIANLMSQETQFKLRLKIFTMLFGWDLDSLWQTANQRLCDVLLRTDRVIEAIESHQFMMIMIDEAAKPSCFEWSNVFKEDCTALCMAKGEQAVAAGDYEGAIKLYSAAIWLDSSHHSLFAHRSRMQLGRNLYSEALSDARMVIELNPSSYLGYELKYFALHGAKLYDEAVDAFKVMLSKLDADPDMQIRDLRKQYVSPSEVERAIRRAIRAQLENTPHRLLNTFTGRLCDREAQINAFKTSTEYKKFLASTIKPADLRSELIENAVETYFRFVMLSHRWQGKEPLLSDIQDKVVYTLNPVGGMVKLQSFCKTAGDAGYRWAWIDTCCIDQSNNVEVQESVNSMFVWYRHSALTIVYLSDVSPSSTPGALAESVWNTRGWTVQEFLAPRCVLFYQRDWTLYLNDRSSNHKESVTIMRELADATGIDPQSLVAFRPGMRDAREKLRWASRRVTTLQEDTAYSLFGIFGIHLPVIYGEKKQNALGRLLQEIVAQSGDITALDWVGQSSVFNSCLPAYITSYHALPCIFPSLSEDEMQALVSSLRNAMTVDLASKLYTMLDNLSAPRFANRRLHLPCIAFRITEVRMTPRQDQETHFRYEVKASGLWDLQITTEDKLVQFSPSRPIWQSFLLVRPWNRYDLGLPDFGDDTQSAEDWSQPWSPTRHSFGESAGDNAPIVGGSDTRGLKLIVRLGQLFGALLLAQQRGGEYKRIASDYKIIAQVQDISSVRSMMDVRTLEIL